MLKSTPVIDIAEEWYRQSVMEWPAYAREGPLVVTSGLPLVQQKSTVAGVTEKER
jgi:hypothetical protein